MTKAIRTVALALFLLLAGNANVGAQANELWWGINYQTALPAGDMKDFVDQFSWRNLGIEGRSFFSPNASVGLYVGWNVFSDEVDGNISLGGLDVSGYQSRWVNAVPMLVTAQFYLRERSGGARTYLGLGIGTYWIENRLALGQTSVTIDNWHLGVAPEVGMVFPAEGYSETYLSVKYNRALESHGIQRSYWTFGIGLASRY